MSDPLDWPLSQRSAHDAAVAVSEPLAAHPRARKKFQAMLSGRLVGAVDKADMLRRLDEVSATFRQLLPEGPQS